MLDTKKVLNVEDSSTANGAKIQLFDRTTNDNSAQKWQLVRDAEGFYELRGVGSGKLLDVSGAQTTDGTPIVLYQDTGSCAQKWAILMNADGSYTLLSQCSARALDVANAAAFNGAKIQIWTRWGENNLAQKWRLNKLDAAELNDGVYILRASGDMVLDVDGAKTTNGAKVQTYVKWGENNLAQQWQLNRGTDGLYMLKGVGSGKMLDVDGAKRTPGAKVQIFQKSESCAQKWVIVKLEAGYRLLSSCSGFAIGTEGAAKNGSAVQLLEAATAQTWTAEKFEPKLENGIYSVVSALNPKNVLDVSGAGTANGSNVQSYVKWGANNTAQQWRVEATGDGHYTLIGIGSGKALDVAGGGTTNGTNVHIYQRNGSCAQKWQVVPTGIAHEFILLSACSTNMALDISGANPSSGANVQIYVRWGDRNLAQIWKFEKI